MKLVRILNDWARFMMSTKSRPLAANVARTVIIIVSACLLLMWGYRALEYELGQIMVRGEDFSGLRLTITREILDSVHLALERYRAQYGSYPTTEGKYFYNEIKQFTAFNNAYIYSDSVGMHDHPVPAPNTEHAIDTQSRSLCYLGIGRAKQVVMYRPVARSYILYSVGENELDEIGAGDDVVYTHVTDTSGVEIR